LTQEADLVFALETFEKAKRTFLPGSVPHLQELFQPALARLDALLADAYIPDCGAREFRIREAAGNCAAALRLAVSSGSLHESLGNFQRASRRICRALESIYDLCPGYAAINRYFLEPQSRQRDKEFIVPEPVPGGGLYKIGLERDPYARGGIAVYVPENLDRFRPAPLVIALHGGGGHGRDFVWEWLREARSRRFLLVAPASTGPTWAILGEDGDAVLMRNVLELMKERWNADPGRVLLTGMSDGATYALKRAMDEDTPFTAFAPVAGVLPPFDLRNVKGRRFFWVHGRKDWMFPVFYAVSGAKNLQAAGADVTLNVVEDLYHAYPREWNAAILDWFFAGCP
jgi:phospholipase/carboxylesterase